MLGQPVSMLIPQVVGFRLTGELPEGATATDLVLTVTEMLRKKGVVGKFVEFFGPGLATPAARRPRHHRQHGPRVRRDLRHLPRRPGLARLPALHRPAGRAGRPGRGLHEGAGAVPHRGQPASRVYSDTLELDLGDRRAEPRRPAPAAGPGAPLARSSPSFRKELGGLAAGRPRQGAPRPAASGGAAAGGRAGTATAARRRARSATAAAGRRLRAARTARW